MEKARWLPLLILMVGSAAIWPLRHWLTAEQIAARSPGQTGVAALFLLALYVVKSLSVAFPLSVLEAAAGLLFPFPVALAVNLGGVLLAHTLPFLLGRQGQQGLNALIARYPQLSALQADALQPGKTVFLLRLAGAAPGDLVSLYLGAAGLPLRAYLLGGFLGSFPRVVAATLLGAALCEIGTSRFWLSLLPGALLTTLSFFLWRRWK